MSICDQIPSWVHPQRLAQLVLCLPLRPFLFLLGLLAAPVPSLQQAVEPSIPEVSFPTSHTVTGAAAKAMSGWLWNFISRGSTRGS